MVHKTMYGLCLGQPIGAAMRHPVQLDILALLLAAACGAGPAGGDREPPPAVQAAGGVQAVSGVQAGAAVQGAAAGARRAEHRVRVARGETVLAAFNGSRASAVLDSKHLTIELTSTDGVHRLAIEIDGATPNTYLLAPTFEATRAVIVLVSHGVPGRVSPAEGELRLLESGDGYCSGSFSGGAQDANGYRHTFEGSFSAVPIRRL